MAEEFKVTYDIPGFVRRRPPSAIEPVVLPPRNDEIIVISSGDEDEESPSREKIKVEDIKPEFPTQAFDPTLPPKTNYSSAPIPIPSTNVNAQPFLIPNPTTYRTNSNGQVRNFAVKSTAKPTVSNPVHSTFPTFDPNNATKSSTTNPLTDLYTPSGRESVVTKRSTPESGFIDQSFDDYQSEIHQDFVLPQSIKIDPVWPSQQGLKESTTNTANESLSKPTLQFKKSEIPFKLPQPKRTMLQYDRNDLRNTLQNEYYAANLPVECAADSIAQLVQGEFAKRFAVVPKKEVLSDQEGNDLLQEINPSTSSCLSIPSCESDAGSSKSNQQQSNRKRMSLGSSKAANTDKRRKQSEDSERSSESGESSDEASDESSDAEENEYEEEEDDGDLDSEISNETELLAAKFRSPKYDPESASDSESEDDGDDNSESSTSASIQYVTEVNTRQNENEDLGDSDTDYGTENDASESHIAPRGPRNTDKSLYWKSQKAQVCPLCRKRSKDRMVSHFTANHKGSEVFVSRISTEMVNIMKNQGKQSYKTDKRHSEGRRIRSETTIQTMCIFCEEKKNFPVNYWVDHIRSHTGEYGNCCRICNKRVSFNNHCGYGTIKKDAFDLRIKDLYAYRCVDCNFVQTQYKNIERHLKFQHKLSTIDKKNYEKFMLMPAYKRIIEQNRHNPNGDQHQDVPRKVPESPHKTVETKKNKSTPAPRSATAMRRQSIMKTDAQLLKAANIPKAIPASLKFDPGDEDILLLVHNEYNALKTMKITKRSPYAVDVRPYILGDCAKKKNINTMTQYALYKCMYEWCLYATNSEKDWKTHMERHIQFMDVLSEKNLMTNNYRSELIKFRECCYCSSQAQDKGESQKKKKHYAHQVCHHMDMEHSRNTFQCAYCFYRTVETDNMVLHMDDHHPNQNHRILIYDLHREFQQNDEEILTDGCKQYIERINCGQGKCTRKFISYSALYAHHQVEHEAKVLQCSYCLDQMRCAKTAMQEHLAQHHGHRHFQEFQCCYCELGYNSVEDIRMHMAEEHASKFLFVGARWNTNHTTATKPTDELQIVYIGDTKDYSSYKLYTCSNFDALNTMDPKELSPRKQFMKLTEIHRNALKAQYFGRLPAISYKYTKKFAEKRIITLQEYEKFKSALATSAFSTKSRQEIASSSKPVPAQQAQKVQFKLSTPTIDRTKHDSKSPDTHQANAKSINSVEKLNLKYPTRPNVLTKYIPSASMVPSVVISSVKYVCITEKMFNDLKTINKFSASSIRKCCECNKPKQINNNKDLHEYVDHFISKHQCQKLSQVSSIEAIQNHRVTFHKRQPLTCLKVKKSNEKTVCELIKFQYECQKCEKRFDTHQEIDLHVLQKHPTIYHHFSSQRIIPDSMVLSVE